MKRYGIKAFTLIELLVVIAIIGLLMSIVAPALSKAKRQAQKVICGTRLKDVGTAVKLYSANFKDELPPSRPLNAKENADAMDPTKGYLDLIWVSRIASYYGLGSKVSANLNERAYSQPIFRCPTQEYYLKMVRQNPGVNILMSTKTGEETKLNVAGGIFGFNVYFSGYGLYDWYGVDNSSSFKGLYDYRKVSRNASSLPLVSDAAAEPYYGWRTGNTRPPDNINIGGWLMWGNDPHPIARSYGWKGTKFDDWASYGPAANHDGAINYLFADGHVEIKPNVWPWNIQPYTGPGDRLYIFHPLGKNQ